MNSTGKYGPSYTWPCDLRWPKWFFCTTLKYVLTKSYFRIAGCKSCAARDWRVSRGVFVSEKPEATACRPLVKEEIITLTTVNIKWTVRGKRAEVLSWSQDDICEDFPGRQVALIIKSHCTLALKQLIPRVVSNLVFKFRPIQPSSLLARFGTFCLQSVLYHVENICQIGVSEVSIELFCPKKPFCRLVCLFGFVALLQWP